MKFIFKCKMFLYNVVIMFHCKSTNSKVILLLSSKRVNRANFIYILLILTAFFTLENVNKESISLTEIFLRNQQFKFVYILSNELVELLPIFQIVLVGKFVSNNQCREAIVLPCPCQLPSK